MIRCVARKPSEPFGISNVHIRNILWTDKPMCYEDILDQLKQKETKKKKRYTLAYKIAKYKVPTK